MNLRRPHWLVLALLLGAGAGFLLLGRQGSGELTSERLAEARAVWELEAPGSYDLELEMRGALNERRIVEVRDGQVVSMTAGGIEVPPASWEYGSIEGLFDTLRAELANAAQPQRSVGAREIVLLASFDPSWGYPKYFYRHIMGVSNDIEWEVVAFSPR